MFGIKYKRTGGVAVTASVHGLIARGNRARDRRDWDGAATAYDQALQAAPTLAHIWMQYGHASKERGDTSTARAAYETAASLRPSDPDPLLHLGHLTGLLGDEAGAGRHYLDCFRADPSHPDAATALYRTITTVRGRDRAELVEVMRRTLGPAGETIGFNQPQPAPGSATTLVFDVSDLILFYGHARLPTGIQRVQIETVMSALSVGGDIRICCLIDGRDDWLVIPVPLFQALVDLSIRSEDQTDPAWITALHCLCLGLALAHRFEFPHGSTLVNLGSSWQVANYFMLVRAAKAEFGIRYVPFVHDLISIVAPEHFTRGTKMEVMPWVLGIFAHADHFLTNSEATKRDLLHTAGRLGQDIAATDVSVIRLDADFRLPTDITEPAAAASVLARLGIEDGPFILLVSTVEPRKGPATAFDAWRRMIDRHGAARVPRLVCVGRKGWLADHLYRRLQDDPVLAGRVAMVSGVSDQDLAVLYGACLLTIYPSLYEGWGLPITEALCHGKPVIAADTSSLPEAGGDFAVYVPPNNAAALAAAVERLAFDEPARSVLSARIRAEFRPRGWVDIVAEIGTKLRQLSDRPTGRVRLPEPPLARLGAYHSLGRSTATSLWPGALSCEAFRTGKGWFAPAHDACSTRAAGGELAMQLPPGPDALRLGLLVHGTDRQDVLWQVSVRNGPSASGALACHGRKWIMLTLPAGLRAADAGPLRLRLRSVPAEPAEPAAGLDDRGSVKLAGFFLHAEADVPAGMRLLEAVAMGNLDDLDVNREPLRSGASDGLWDD